MKDIISIIVPIYNAEKYLEACIESIIRQTYKRLEIILVDDCSNDKSAEICDAYAREDARIKVIHRKEKGGEGGAKARNHGISQATGNLLYFMDSDDYIEYDMLEKMYTIMCEEQSQCVVTSFHYVDSEGNELKWRAPKLSDYSCMNGEKAARLFLTSVDIEGFSWNKLIRKEIIEKKEICFDEAMNSFVDMYAMFKTILYSDKVSFYDAQPYYYRQHNVSCVHTMTQRKLNNYHRVITQISNLAAQNDMKKESEFFSIYRMVTQLFDTVKAKKKYDKNIWKQIKTDFAWEKIFNKSIWQIYHIIFSFWHEYRVKTMIKLLVVRIYFN